MRHAIGDDDFLVELAGAVRASAPGHHIHLVCLPAEADLINELKAIVNKWL